MTDETSNLVLQHLRAIREEMKDMRVALDTGLDDVRVRMDNFDKQMEGFLGELGADQYEADLVPRPS